ncbi:hypothetical protein FNV43_RR08552 [Rhamnella rubrinervis]|uniref:Uncharacterized protein n=1 Tax=Rhamnella rubrinervis TaxID=2594499 RepID=A0A8K0MJ17_9ROSA|nr:hypothetical protein FNV43_RR08552 [Rhamnella rubrinervis]
MGTDDDKVVAVHEASAITAQATSSDSTPAATPTTENVKGYMSSGDVKATRGLARGEAHKIYAGFEDKPSKLEVFGWCLYELCSYFIYTVLIPIVFPLIVSQIVDLPKEVGEGWVENRRGYKCMAKELRLYHRLTLPGIKVNHAKYSALEWTSISWAVGVVMAAPILAFLSTHLDRGRNQAVIAIAATAIGAIFCLPAGFFRTVWIFPPYIAVIIAAITVASACHTRHLGLMVRGFTGPAIQKARFHLRRGVSGWLSLYAAAAGSLGAAIFASFTYHMLKGGDEFTSLWVVSIYSGLIWLVGVLHFLTTNRPSNRPCISRAHAFSIFKFPHALGSLAGVFLSSLTTMCLFTGTVLYLVGDLCYTPKSLLFFWLTYFIFPILSLPFMHPFQHLLKTDSMKMQVLGFALSAFTAGMGFYFRGMNWRRRHVLVLTLFQSASTGILHAFGRVLLLDCSPYGKEGAFSTWFMLMKVLGTGVGFTIASLSPGNVRVSFGVAFFTSIAAMVVLIFGNVSDFDGAVGAGHVVDHGGNYGDDHGVDSTAGSSAEIKESSVQIN